MKKLTLSLLLMLIASASFGQFDQWSTFGPWVKSECFHIQFRVQTYYDSKEGVTSFNIEWKNNYSKGVSFKDVNFSDVREADAFFRSRPPSGGTQSNINLEAYESRVYSSRRNQTGTGKQTYVYIYHLEMEGDKYRRYSPCVNGELCPACFYNAGPSCPNGSSSNSNLTTTNQVQQTTNNTNYQSNSLHQNPLLLQSQSQSIPNPQEQEKKQQELKRQQDAQKTAAYVDLGVQTVKGISDLIISNKQEKIAKSELEYQQRQSENYIKGNEIRNKIYSLSNEFAKTPDLKIVEQIADLYYELGQSPYLYPESEKQAIYKEHSSLLYTKLVSDRYYSYNVILKYFQTLSNEQLYKDAIQRKKNFKIIYKYTTDKFLESKDAEDKENFFVFAKIHAYSLVLANDFDEYGFKEFIENKKKEKFWLEKAANLNHPKAMLILANYYNKGDFLFTKNEAKCKEYAEKAKSLGLEYDEFNFSNFIEKQNLVKLNEKDLKQLDEIIVKNNPNKLRKFLIQISDSYGFKYSGASKNSYFSYFNKFNLIGNQLISNISDFDLVKLFGNSKLYLKTDHFPFGEFHYGDFRYKDSSKTRGFPGYELSFIDNGGINISSDEIIKMQESYWAENNQLNK